MSARFDALSQWLSIRHGLDATELKLTPVADDAGFRRYFRLSLGAPLPLENHPEGNSNTRIIMDAPPDKEDSHGFVSIALMWLHHGLPTPRIYAADLSMGFVELEDLGNEQLRSRLNMVDTDTQDVWLDRAMSLSARIAAHPCAILPPYDHARLAFELDLFPQWALDRWLNIATPSMWKDIRNTLLERVIAQPRVTTHRDYHPENLMIDACGNLRVIDFQGAWAGAIGYDPGALLRDRNAPWPLVRQQRHYAAHHQYALEHGLTSEQSSELYLNWIDEASAQRSIKVLGLFCRLAARDSKPRYLLNHEVHFLAHLREALTAMASRETQNAPLWQDFLHWLEDEFEPRMMQQITLLRNTHV